ncbi:MAG: hypothetical protein GOMPHAMPRED_000303 [Gomphillus americanus]|uniref:RRM domain-containing protein n=1 Tax=Gomphillus americanus TaxID=1940652 RepID=A0A8H3HUZ6_9LECA|nr:MAG: hypothetical protein GOMPHAMPRED_000303 [Gomphillus americanus]
MSDKLDQSLDQILATRRATGGRGRGRNRGGRRGAGPTTTAPTGGVQKKTKTTTKPATKPTTNGTGLVKSQGVDTKIIVSNLPRDVDEKQIQEYFSQSVGPVKKVWLNYGPNGASQGRAEILFKEPGGANKALKVNNGVLVEGKPMKIEIIVDAKRAAAAKDAGPKSLSDRITGTKSAAAQPKSAAAKKDKNAEKGATGNTRGGRVVAGRGRGTKRGRNAGRPKSKTADQLDAEMTDYFNIAPDAGTNGTATAADTDAGMDEIA